MQRYKLVELVSFPQETNAFEQFLYVQLRQGWRYLNYTPLGVVFENMALDSFTEKKKLSIEDIQKKLDTAISNIPH